MSGHKARGGASRKSPPPLSFDHHPMLAIWEVTQACDLVCVHCRACATTKRDTGELTTDEGKRLLEQIAFMGTPMVVLTGGDPAKRPDLVELVEHGCHCGLEMAVTPSGTPTMTRDLMFQLKDSGLSRLAVSVDGPDASTHDAFRGVQGSFSESVRILSTAHELELPTQINTTLHPGNAHLLPKMADFVREIGAVLWSVFVVVPTGRANSSMLLSSEAQEASLIELASIAENAPFDVKTTAAPYFRRILLERKTKNVAIGLIDHVDDEGNIVGPRGITDGVGFMFVSHKGEIYPSGFLPISAGNIREKEIGEVYRNSPLFQKLRDVSQLLGKCGACPFKRVCGGSRARAFAQWGDPMAEDSLCAYTPKNWQGGPTAPQVKAKSLTGTDS